MEASDGYPANICFPTPSRAGRARHRLPSFILHDNRCRIAYWYGNIFYDVCRPLVGYM